MGPPRRSVEVAWHIRHLKGNLIYIGLTQQCDGLHGRLRQFHWSTTTGLHNYAGGVTYYQLFGPEVLGLVFTVHVAGIPATSPGPYQTICELPNAPRYSNTSHGTAARLRATSPNGDRAYHSLRVAIHLPCVGHIILLPIFHVLPGMLQLFHRRTGMIGTGIDRAACGLRGLHDTAFTLLLSRPKKRWPFQFVPVMALATADRLEKVLPLQA